MHTFIHLITFIQYIYPSPFAEASLHFLIACLLSGETPPWAAEARIELGPALQQADALPTEPRRTLNWATPHIQLSHAPPFLSHAAPCWATPHLTFEIQLLCFICYCCCPGNGVDAVVLPVLPPAVRLLRDHLPHPPPRLARLQQARQRTRQGARLSNKSHAFFLLKYFFSDFLFTY